MKNSQKTYTMILMSLFIAIIILQTSIPFLGYIPAGALNITIIHVTVIAVALSLGPKKGALIGGIWGVITFIRAFVAPTSPLAAMVFVNPMISVLPRILIGIVGYYVYALLFKMTHKDYFSMNIGALMGSLTNTILVLGQIYLFYKNHSMALYHVDTHKLLPYLLGVAGINGLLEAVVAVLVAPAIAKVIKKAIKK